MNKRLTTLFLATVLFLGSGILSLDAAGAPKAKKPLTEWNDADWKAYGTSLASKPAVKKMDPLDRAKYIADQVGKKYDAAGIAPNNWYFGKGRQGLGGKASGTCGDLTVNLGAALEGAGFQTGSLEVEKRSYNPFNVNRNHGAPIVMVDGKEYVFDLWYHSGAEGKFSGFKDSPFIMPRKDWETQMKQEGYKISTYVPPPPPPGRPRPAKPDPKLQKLIQMGATPKEAKAALDGGHKDVAKLTKRLQKQNEQLEKEAKKKAELQAKADAEAAKEQQEFAKKYQAEEDRKEALRQKEIEKEEAIARLKEKIRKSKEDGKPPAEDEVKPEEATAPTDDEVKPEDESKPGEKEAVAPETQRRGRKPDDLKEKEPESEKEVAPPEEEPEPEPEAVPEPGDSVDNADGSTTTTKGYVENENGRITITETRNPDGSVTTTTTETDRDGNVISETTYGESGEGKTTRPDNKLRDSEAESDAEVDAETAANGANTSSSYGDRITEEQQQRAADGASTMAENSQMDEASNVGNQQTRDARTVRNRAGREAQAAGEASRRNTAKSDRENSWGKAMGDAVESGITEGGKAFGQAFGGVAADRAVGAIFGTSEAESDSSGERAGKSAVQGTAAGGTAASGGGSTKANKKKPRGNRGGGRGGGSGGGGSGGGGSEVRDGDILISTVDDIPVDGADMDDPIGVRGSSQNDDGTVTITYGCGYTWTGKPPGPSRCPICSRETISTESNSPEEEEEEEPDSSYEEPAPATPEEDAPCTGQTCGRCGYCPCRRLPPGPGDSPDTVCWFSCPKCGWKISMVK